MIVCRSAVSPAGGGGSGAICRLQSCGANRGMGASDTQTAAGLKIKRET
jgi:hypothetical protein